MLDLIISVVILVVAVGTVYIYFNETVSNDRSAEMANNIMSIYTTEPIRNINIEGMREIIDRGDVRNVENTLAQQAGKFYYRGEENLAQEITHIYMDWFERDNYNFEVVLLDEDTEVTLYYSSERTRNLEEAQAVSSVSRETLGYINRTDYYNYELRVRVWQ